VAYRTDAVIIGAGQAGLAASRCLTDFAIDHVLIERGDVGERWRSERWKSLHLLTPNWMTRLPGYSYSGSDPDGFMRLSEVVHFLEGYGRTFDAPVITRTRVLDVSSMNDGYRVSTDRGVWLARCVIVATGACDRPNVPDMATALPRDISQVVPGRYQCPDDLPVGGVLVAGASASGVQLAEEIHRSGRPVTIAVGRHVRIPRTYRGRDIMAWLDDCGFLAERRPPDADPCVLNRQPSLQLVGHPDRRSLDLARLAETGVRIVGRALGVSGHTVGIACDLPQECAAAEQRRRKLLARIDSHIQQYGIEAADDPLAWLRPCHAFSNITRLDLRAVGIRTVVWATGYRRAYPWLSVPVTDDAGEIRNVCGVTDAPGLFVIGLPFMSHRSSTFIDGVGRDAETIAAAVAGHLRQSSTRAA